MPPASADPGRLEEAAATLGPLRLRAAEAVDELLGQLVDAGDGDLQGALDGYLERASDVLRAVDATAGELALALRAATDAAGAPRVADVPDVPDVPDRVGGDETGRRGRVGPPGRAGSS